MIVDVSNYKNIRNASIVIDGITVICGETKSRKSELLKRVKDTFVDSGMRILDLNHYMTYGDFTLSELSKHDKTIKDMLSRITDTHQRTKCEMMLWMTLHRTFDINISFKDYINVKIDDLRLGDKDYVLFYILLAGLTSGFIDETCTIFFDSAPGSYHPVTAVEIAKLFINIANLTGCKFVMTSDNADFVSAIESIGLNILKENVINFYLAEQNDISGNQYYSYKNTGCQIGDIFSSFNKAFQLIDIYSTPVNSHDEERQRDS